MWHIINALLLRELKTRFGKNPTLGYIWVILEPMIHVVFMLLIFTLIKNKVLPQVPFSLFLISGMVPFFMFRNIVKFLINAIEANKPLFAYKPLRPIHVFLARTLLEGVIHFIIIFILMVFFGFFAGFNVMPHNLVYVLLIFIWLVVISFALGLILSIILHEKVVLKNIINYLLMVFYFGSAVIFPLWVLPNNVVNILAYNPILHILELLKENYFIGYPVVAAINVEYPLIFTLVLLFFGLGLYYKKRVELSTV